MKKLMLIGLLSFVAIGLFAQKSSLGTAKSGSKEKSDPQAESILNKVNTKYASYKSMKMDLKVTIQDGKFKEEQTAKVSVKGNKFKIDSKDQLIISDGKKNWIYLKEADELQISKPDPDDVGMFSSPDKLLKTYQEEFISGYMGLFKLSGKIVHKIEFKPMDKNSEYSKVAVYIDKTDLTVVKIKVFDKSNIHYSIRMENFVKNTTMKDTDFKFDESTVSEENIIRLCDGC
ncbi:MAG: outer membrane lipoprotein carrier protein LolA [Saprospiraceae bacterium]